MVRPWEANPSAEFKRRIGRSALELGNTNSSPSCPDIWELDNGDFAVIGRDVTVSYTGRLPSDVSVAADERIVVIPHNMLIAAKPEIPHA
ncbi:hypothetical protein AB0M95_18360 [Sphaerisporangium sp. NPDC051017]|uniref:hypothetical protein n=1 Tax=Sphaerisporangium sp. NPDC051017 TaxID=3154636 RepID=UPI003444CBFE